MSKPSKAATKLARAMGTACYPEDAPQCRTCYEEIDRRAHLIDEAVWELVEAVSNTTSAYRAVTCGHEDDGIRALILSKNEAAMTPWRPEE